AAQTATASSPGPGSGSGRSMSRWPSGPPPLVNTYTLDTVLLLSRGDSAGESTGQAGGWSAADSSAASASALVAWTVPSACSGGEYTVHNFSGSGPVLRKLCRAPAGTAHWSPASTGWASPSRT